MSVRARIRTMSRPACEPLEGRTLFAGGDPDVAFGSGGHALLNFAGAPFEAKSVALRSDGKTVIAGTKGGRLAVVRLNVDGTLDTGFGGGGLFESSVASRATDVALQPGDDKIVVTAIAPRVGGGPDPNRFTTVRILADGQGLDPAFDGDGVVEHRYGDDGLGGYCYANAVAVQRDGKIVVGGVANIDNITYFTNDFAVARYNPDGSPDATFGTRVLGVPLTWNNAAMGGRDEILDLAIDYNGDPSSNPLYGSIVAVGDTDNHWGAGWVPQGSQFAVARFRPNGTLDGSLDGDGKLTISFPTAQTAWAAGVLIQPGGKIVVTGAAGPNNGPRDQVLARFESNGDLDPTFKGGRVWTDLGGDDLPSGAAVGYLGGILVAGSTGVAAYSADGVRDTRFGQDGLLTGISAAGGIATTGNTILPTRRLVFAGGNRVHRYIDAGDNPVAIGSFDSNGGSEAGPENANFLVTRTVATPSPLRVYLGVSGTALAPFFIGPSDYLAGDGFTSFSPFEGGTYVDIPANQRVVSVAINPTNDLVAEGDETAIFSIIPDPSYDIGSPGSVTLELHDNDASTFYPVADAHVRDGESAFTNFGSANLLETGLGAAAGDGLTREAYIKFDISSLNPAALSNVRLRLFGRLSDGGSAAPAAVFGVSASGWGEDALTFINRPPASTPALGTVDVTNSGETPYDFNVTQFVMRERAAGRAFATLLVRSTAPGAAHLLWSSRHSEYSDPRLIVTGGNLAGLVPRVTQVFVSSSAWTPAFRQRVEDAGLGDSAWGYAVRGGADQLKALPWDKLDQVSIRFTSGVNVLSEHLAVRGVRGGDYAVTNFHYDQTNFVATWTLGTALGRGGLAAGAGDKVLLDLDGDDGTGVASFFQRFRYLDGDWVNGADAYDSGNGSEGGDFRFQVNALRGDVDGDGRVSASDLSALRAHLLRGTSDPFSGANEAYSPRYDLTGDGRIGVHDLAALRASLFGQLPAASPTAPASESLRPPRLVDDRRGLWIEDLTAAAHR